MPKGVPIVITIGGSDSSGGAGIQEDLKVFSAFDVHGCSVIACVTAQNTRRITSIFPLPSREVEKQLSVLTADIEPKAVKTGMLYSGGIASVVANHLRELVCPVVVDPVMVASVGKKLYTKDFLDALEKEIVPLATVLTPNIDEASKLSGTNIESVDDAKRSAEVIAEMGAENVIVKGVPTGREMVDVLFDGRAFTEFRGHRFDKNVHGSGCTFASALAALLGKGFKLKEAVQRGRRFVSRGYMFSYKIGSGLKAINSHYKVDRYVILKELDDGVEELKSFLKTSMVPEVGVNFGYALPFASSKDEVCAIRGRLSKEGKE